MANTARDGGVSWLVVETVDATQHWTTHSFRLSEFPDAVGDQLRIRFTTSDLPSPGDSLTEAGVDEFHIRAIACSTLHGDANGDGKVNLVDYKCLWECWMGPVKVPADPACSAFDLHRDGHVDLKDVWAFENHFQP